MEEEKQIIEERKKRIIAFLKKDRLSSAFIILAAIAFIFSLTSKMAFLSSISLPPLSMLLSTINSIRSLDWFLLGLFSLLSAIFSFYKKDKYIFYPILAWIVWLTVFIRTLPLSVNSSTGKPGLWDITRNTWTLGPDLDPFLFLRWMKDIVSTGTLYAIDMMRYVPLGFNVKEELILHPYLMAWFHKLAVPFGSPSVEYSAIIYPVFMFALTVICFFFFVRKVFIDELGSTTANLIALLSSFLFSIIPSLLPRTVAGIPEKEASGFLFLFLAFYFFISSWKSKSIKAQYLHSILAGISTSLMALVWGGYIYIYLSIALTAGLAFLSGHTNKQHFFTYAIWLFLSMAIISVSTERFSFYSLLTSANTGIATLIFGVMFIHFLLTTNRLSFITNYLQKTKMNGIPLQFISLGIVIVLAIIGSFLIGPSFLTDKAQGIVNQLVSPTTDRLGVTVAENRQPFFDEWANSFGPPFLSFAQYLTQYISFKGFSFPENIQKSWSTIPIFFWLFILGSIYLFYYFTKSFSFTDRLILVFGYSIFLFGVVFSRYRPEHILNGTNNMSLFIYALGFFALLFVLGKKGVEDAGKKSLYYKVSALALFLLFIWTNYYKENFLFMALAFLSLSCFAILAVFGITKQENLKKIDLGILLLFAFFFLSIVSARGAVRLIMMLGLPSAIIVSALLIIVIKGTIKIQSQPKKAIAWFILIVILLSTIFSAYAFYESTKGQSRSQVPYQYTFQWQKAMSWVRDNTPKNAVFGHWWDYGYWIQSIGERATVLDGGNAIPYWNHLMGRHALTGKDNRAALEYLFAHNTTHFLIDPTDIGKYSAFSSIGSDLKSDRASFIHSMTRDNGQTKELKNGLEYFYYPTGRKYESAIPLDADIKYNNNGTEVDLIAGGSAVIGITIESDSLGTLNGQPEGIFVYTKKNGQQVEEVFPMRYAFYNNLFKDFGSGIEVGAFFMQKINDQGAGGFTLEKEGSLLYLSNKTVKSQLARLYLYKEDNPNFKLVHTQDSPIVEQSKLSGVKDLNDIIYFGGVQGPIRIWEIKYPENMTLNEQYLSKTFPDIRLTR